jgi:F0F1-type ATP synthase membrane subunit c/vacuolar-type H+-ATPase subunit K
MIVEFKMMGAGLACSGLGGVGQGIGQIFSSLLEAMSNNPGVSNGLFNYALIGFALTGGRCTFYFNDYFFNHFLVSLQRTGLRRITKLALLEYTLL